MSIKLGISDIDDIKLGANNVDKVYLGANAVWEKSAPTPDTYVEYESMSNSANNSGYIELTGIVPNNTTELRFLWYLDVATSGYSQETATNNVLMGEFDSNGEGYGVIQSANAQDSNRVDLAIHLINGETYDEPYINVQAQKYLGSRGLNSPSNEYHRDDLKAYGSNYLNWAWYQVNLLSNAKVCTKDLIVFGGYRGNTIYPFKQRQVRLSQIYLNHNNVEYDLRICKRQSDGKVCLVDPVQEIVFVATSSTFATIFSTGNSWTF